DRASASRFFAALRMTGYSFVRHSKWASPARGIDAEQRILSHLCLLVNVPLVFFVHRLCPTRLTPPPACGKITAKPRQVRALLQSREPTLGNREPVADGAAMRRAQAGE